MTETLALSLLAQAMVVAAKLASPIILGAMSVGLSVSIFQSVTSIQESTLSFVPKLVAVGGILAGAGHWMLTSYIGYVDSLFASIPKLLGGG